MSRRRCCERVGDRLVAGVEIRGGVVPVVERLELEPRRSQVGDRGVSGRAGVPDGRALERRTGGGGEQVGTGRPQADDDDPPRRRHAYPGGAVGAVVPVIAGTTWPCARDPTCRSAR